MNNLPVLVMNRNTQRESGQKAQLGNITAAKAVADIIRTTLGPRSMLKMILDPMGGIIMTNDGFSILREIDVNHPAAKSMIELSRAQDEEVGDGTTSVIILAGEILYAALPFFQKDRIHPTLIVSSYRKALDDCLIKLEQISTRLDVNDHGKMISVLKSTLGTKFVSRFGDIMPELALKAVKMVSEKENDRVCVDLKRFVKIEKIPGGEMADMKVIDGVMLNKDITLASMRRRIENPRIMLLDCPLEYKKAESQTNIEMLSPNDWEQYLEIEEQYIKQLCQEIISLKPDIVITEKGVSDLAQHFLQHANISVLRRVRKSDNNRIAKATGAIIGNEPKLMTENDIGKRCGLFEIRKIGDEYWTFLDQCDHPKACTILLRGASKDILSEIERNLHDAMQVARNITLDSRVVPGGGATEMTLASFLRSNSNHLKGYAIKPYKAIADALEVIPRTLIENCGSHVMRVLTELRAKHSDNQLNVCYGIDGEKGVLADMNELNIWEPFLVKSQTIKTAIESATLLLRIDDILSGLSKGKKGQNGQQKVDGQTNNETFGDERDG